MRSGRWRRRNKAAPVPHEDPAPHRPPSPSAGRRPQAIVFIDGQNLFHGAKEYFGRKGPDYDPIAIAQAACQQAGWDFAGVRFYTGIPTPKISRFWAAYWERRLASFGRRNIEVCARPLKPRYHMAVAADGSPRRVMIPVEKGIDVRIAIDMVRAATERACDAMILFSSDNDLREATEEVARIAADQRRRIPVASAFCDDGLSRTGIRGTSWLRIDRMTYQYCVDHRHAAACEGATQAVGDHRARMAADRGAQAWGDGLERSPAGDEAPMSEAGEDMAADGSERPGNVDGVTALMPECELASGPVL